MSLLGKGQYCPLIPPRKKSSNVPAVLPWQKSSIAFAFLWKRPVLYSLFFLGKRAVPFCQKGQYFSLHLSFAERQYGVYFSSLTNMQYSPSCLSLAKGQYCLPYQKPRITPLVLSWQKGSIAPLLKGPLIPPWLTCYSHCPITAEHSMCECMSCVKYFFFIMIIQFGWAYKILLMRDKLSVSKQHYLPHQIKSSLYSPYYAEACNELCIYHILLQNYRFPASALTSVQQSSYTDFYFTE